MNIFILSKDPVKAARYQCDKHVVKMVLETAQLLCSAFEKDVAPYRRTHYNHPCAKWTRYNKANYTWLLAHGLALCNEYSNRYGRTHKSQEVIQWCYTNINLIKFESSSLQATSFPQAMPDDVKSKNPVKAYRNYYFKYKFNIATWKKCSEPKWWLRRLNEM